MEPALIQDARKQSEDKNEGEREREREREANKMANIINNQMQYAHICLHVHT